MYSRDEEGGEGIRKRVVARGSTTGMKSQAETHREGSTHSRCCVSDASGENG
jgi:hypothetical protein